MELDMEKQEMLKDIFEKIEEFDGSNGAVMDSTKMRGANPVLVGRFQSMTFEDLEEAYMHLVDGLSLFKTKGYDLYKIVKLYPNGMPEDGASLKGMVQIA